VSKADRNQLREMAEAERSLAWASWVSPVTEIGVARWTELVLRMQCQPVLDPGVLLTLAMRTLLSTQGLMAWLLPAQTLLATVPVPVPMTRLQLWRCEVPAWALVLDPQAVVVEA